MIEFIGNLIEVPEKRKMYFVFAIKMVLSVTLADFLYRNIISDYHILTPFSGSSYSDFYQYLVSGTAIVALFLHFVSSIALFMLLPALFNPLINLLETKKKKGTPLKDAFFVRLILRWSFAVKFDTKGETIYRGRDFEGFYTMICEYRKKSAKRDLSDFKHSLINEFIKIYAAFMAIYFTILDFQSPLLDVVIIVSAAVLLLFYIALHNFTLFMDLNENGLFAIAKMLKAEEAVNEILEQIYFKGQNPEKSYLSPLGMHVFTAYGKVLIDFYASDLPLTTKAFTRLNKIKGQDDLSAIIIINCLNAEIADVSISQDDIHILPFRSEKKLQPQLRSLLRKIN